MELHPLPAGDLMKCHLADKLQNGADPIRVKRRARFRGQEPDLHAVGKGGIGDGHVHGADDSVVEKLAGEWLPRHTIEIEAVGDLCRREGNASRRKCEHKRIKGRQGAKFATRYPPSKVEW